MRLEEARAASQSQRQQVPVAASGPSHPAGAGSGATDNGDAVMGGDGDEGNGMNMVPALGKQVGES